MRSMLWRPAAAVVVSGEAILMHDPIGFDPFGRFAAIEDEGLLHSNLLLSCC